jgi:hypothetical protein
MRKLIFICLIVSFHFTFGQNVSVTLYNTTGYDMDSVYFAGIRIGKMAKDDSATLTGLKEITMIGIGNSTLESATGIIKGKNMALPELGCGTGSYTVNSGSYKFYLVLQERLYKKNVYTIIKVMPNALEMIIFNKTPYDLDSTFIGGIYVGRIKRDSSITVYTNRELEIEYLKTGGLIPANPPSTVIAGKSREGKEVKGKNVKTFTTGHYKFDICVPDKGNENSLIWKSHY